ncbi:MAG TPA: thioredoxin [Acidimicrobiia bacterium]|jgi:thioredoxin 1
MSELVTNVVRGSEAERLLLLVHGYGADERDLGGLLQYLDPGGRFATVLPRGPHQAPGTPGYSWFEIGGGGFDQAGFTSSLDALDDLVDEQCEELGLPRDTAIFGGFSQGAGLALILGLRASQRSRPAGILAMSPFAPAAESVELDFESAAKTPVLIQHGTEDPLIPVRSSRSLAQQLKAEGVPVVYSEYPMGHQVALESVEQARDWLTAVVAGERPSEPMPEPPAEGPVPAVTTATFPQEVLQSDVPVIVDFWAPWCGPCRQVGPIVEQIAAMRGDAYKVVKVNIDEEPALQQEYEVQSIPLIALFRNGRLERASLGAKPRPQLEADLGMLVIP